MGWREMAHGFDNQAAKPQQAIIASPAGVRIAEQVVQRIALPLIALNWYHSHKIVGVIRDFR
jgi:hypothetical protein